MSKLEIEFPAAVIFSTVLEIHNVYINRGNHIGNSRYVDICNEVTQRFFASRSVPEYTIGEQVLINTSFSVQLKSEAKYLDLLSIDLAADSFHRCGCDFIFRISQRDSSTVVALARFSFLTLDYKLGKVVSASDQFRDFFSL